MDVCGFMPAVGGCRVVTPPLELEPHAVTAMMAAAAAAAMRSALCQWLPFISPLLSFLYPGRKRDQGPRPGARACLQGPGTGPGRPYSAVLPRVTRRGRDGR